ncbi:MAG TPA: hypothetical protein PLG66_16315, partial [Calditrichia bacterium]|nr:hypothetical protein [Calditrichia bacterium]
MHPCPIKRFAFFALLLLAFNTSLGATPVPAALDSLVLAGKEELYNLQFQEARKTFAAARQQFPDYPHGYVFQAYLSAMYFGLDESNDSLAAHLKKQIEIALDQSRDFQSRFPDNPDGPFYIAITSGIEALYHIIERNFLSAYWSGRRAKKSLEKVIEQDSTYYDAYIGLGLFHYYADLLPGVVKFFAGLLGFEGDRDGGKKEIELAGRKGRYFRVEGDFISHGISYFLEGAQSEGLRGINRLYQRYPRNYGFGLIVAYHYRKSGSARRCIEYCREMTAPIDEDLPQLINMKYYNMAISYFNLNAFETSDSLLNVLEKLPTRKSRFYQAAISYYRGYMADLRFERRKALAYYNRIPDTKKARYWYLISRPNIKYAADSLTLRYQKAYNLLLTHRTSDALLEALALKKVVDKGITHPNPDFGSKIYDLLAYTYYLKRDYPQARAIYEVALPRLERMQDPFDRAWMYMHYQRCLRELKEYDLAEAMLNRVDDIDESYTKLIV